MNFDFIFRAHPTIGVESDAQIFGVYMHVQYWSSQYQIFHSQYMGVWLGQLPIVKSNILETRFEKSTCYIFCEYMYLNENYSATFESYIDL